MRVLGLDFETTGLDTSKDRITEIGAVVWETDTSTPILVESAYLYDDTYPPLSQEIVELTGITSEQLREFGERPKYRLIMLDYLARKSGVQYIVAHNGENFDKPLLLSELRRHGLYDSCLEKLPWIDTRTDLPFKKEPKSRSLNHLAYDYGFLNPFSHRAVFDVLTMLRVLSQFDIQAVLEYQRIPFAVCRAVVGYEDREKAKAQRFSWEKIDEQVWPKFWVKKVKLNQLAAEQALAEKAGFQVVQIA